MNNSDLTPEQRGLRNIVQMTEESDYMPKYLPPMYDDALPEIDERKLEAAKMHPGIRRFAAFSRRYLRRLRGEGRA